jgi:hypothetical protein
VSAGRARRTEVAIEVAIDAALVVVLDGAIGAAIDGVTLIA